MLSSAKCKEALCRVQSIRDKLHHYRRSHDSVQRATVRGSMVPDTEVEDSMELHVVP